MVTEKTFTKEAQNFFWFQVGYIKISEIFYKIQKFQRTSWAPIITTNGIYFLMAGPSPSSFIYSGTFRVFQASFYDFLYLKIRKAQVKEPPSRCSVQPYLQGHLQLL